MPTSSFHLASPFGEGIFTYNETGFTLTNGRGVISLRPQISTVATESWDVVGLTLSLVFKYAAAFYSFTEPGKKELNEAKTARKKAYEFAQKAVTQAGAAITFAKGAEEHALKAQEFALKVDEALKTNESKQKLEEAAQAVESAKQTTKNAEKELENAHQAEEGALEELKKVEHELADLGMGNAIEGLFKEPTLLSSFVEFGPSGEPFLIQDFVTHRTTTLSTTQSLENSAKVTGIVREQVDQRFDFSNALHMTERMQLVLGIVITSGRKTEERQGAELTEIPTLEILSAQFQYTAQSLADQRREPSGPRPGR